MCRGLSILTGNYSDIAPLNRLGTFPLQELSPLDKIHHKNQNNMRGICSLTMQLPYVHV